VKQDAAARRRRIARVVLFLLLAVLAILPIWWHLMLPDPPDGIPGNLNQRDRDEIARLCRVHTLGLVGNKVRQGEFRSVSFGAGRLFTIGKRFTG
jgi:hypothetical protein